MNKPSECRHDFRRVYAETLRRSPPSRDARVLAVLCCGCGKSPLALTIVGRPSRFDVTGDWPVSTHRITEFGSSQETGPFVEFELVE